MQSQKSSDEITEETYKEGRSALVIGMGLFGSAVAKALTRHGWFVLAVDGDQSKLNAVVNEVSAVRVINAVDLNIIQSLEPSTYDVCISAIGDENAHVITTTIHNLKQCDAQMIIARTTSYDHSLMFSKLGCDLILEPEKSFGQALSLLLHKVDTPTLIKTVDLDLSIENLKKHHLSLIKPNEAADNEEEYSSKVSIIMKVIQILIWGVLLQYCYNLSVELDRVNDTLQTQTQYTNTTHTFVIVMMTLIILWYLALRLFKPNDPSS